MRKLSIVFALILIVLAVLPAAAQDRQIALTLERTPCFGACPIYSVTIYTDGTVEYNGTRFVTVEGEQTGSIDPETVQQLVAGFEAAGYFDWNDEYNDRGTSDLPTIITSVTRDGETRQITRYAGDASAPLALPYLETWIDLAAHTSPWTGADVSPTIVMSANEPSITLERQPCFGMCPVYALNIFADGTVVYLGIDHVAVTGVQVETIEPSAVEALVSEMTAFGYLDWQDEYTHQTITDQAYVITWLSTPEQFKRILRYDGDANAPVGLVRIEDRIDALVNSAQWVTSAD